MKNTLRNMTLTGLVALAAACQTIPRQSWEEANKPLKSPTAENNCYLQIFIREKKENNALTFSVDSVREVSGNNGHLVRPHYRKDSCPVIIETYDHAGKILEQYDFHSPRFLIAEDFSGKKLESKIIELRESVGDIYIPYDTSAKSIKINRFGIKQNLHIDPS